MMSEETDLVTKFISNGGKIKTLEDTVREEKVVENLATEYVDYYWPMQENKE